jgi:hypothetical protein
VDPEVEAALRAIDEAVEWATSYRFEITEEYLQLIAQVEAMPQNQSGADKSYVWRAQRAYREFFKNARLVPREP